MFKWDLYIEVRIGKHLFDVFTIQNGLKQGNGLSSFIFNFGSEFVMKNLKETKGIGIEWASVPGWRLKFC